jgi:hypothetical protein
MAVPLLPKIRTKVRRITRAPSPEQITNTEIDEYINDFVLYDMPEHLRLFALREKFSFTCQANIDTYQTDATAAVLALRDFDQNYITVHQPVFIAGQPVYYSEDRTEFYGMFPMNNAFTTVGTGNGALTNFTGTISNKPILQNSVLFESVTATPLVPGTNNITKSARDVPTSVTEGNLVDTETLAILGTINYLTGAFTITWAGTPPGAQKKVVAQYIPYQAGRPTAMLYFDDYFVLRPVPDQAYVIDFEVYKRPIALSNANLTPKLEQWWQYIAYGAAKKVFEDRSDFDSVQQIMPEFQKQEDLVNRRTEQQYVTKRIYTPYAQQVENNNWPSGWNGYGF